MMFIDFNGKPYTPTKDYGLSGASRANLARSFNCSETQVEWYLDNQARWQAWVADRLEYEDPMGYRRHART